MKISVIITVCNRSKFLRESVASAIKQRPVPEIIVVDDGSDAGKRDQIHEAISDFPEIKLIGSQENKGVSAARNIGAKHAKNDFVLFLDDDDWLLPGYFQNVARKIGRADVLLSKSELFNSGTAPGQFRRLERFYLYNRERFHHDVSDRLYFQAYVPAIHGAIFRRELFGDFRFEESLSYGEDRYLLMQMKEAGAHITITNQVNAAYRVHHKLPPGRAPLDYLDHLQQSGLLKSHDQKKFQDFQRGYFELKRGQLPKGAAYLAKSLVSPQVRRYLLGVLWAVYKG